MLFFFCKEGSENQFGLEDNGLVNRPGGDLGTVCYVSFHSMEVKYIF